MTSLPNIIIQLIHIEGPLKGEIQEFIDQEISIGRFPDCQVKFPIDFAVVSRNHARIIREGNRFKLIDSSTNGTFVNGNSVKEHYLKSGDVITFAEGGPKVSFLTQVEADHPQPPRPVTPGPVKADQTVELGATVKVAAEKVPTAFVIQYGPTLRSFNELPIIMGRAPDCDFILDHPDIQGRHVQFFFSHGQYCVKDMTGKNLITIDGRSIDTQAVLNPDTTLSLSPNGPTFRFLGGGRLAEFEG
ncbi:MAG: FHA domain-containing protein [Desulfobacteraceae bacterium]|jgi:pSer/pThr/pTyr-binding forkhead associated (FHA) protein